MPANRPRRSPLLLTLVSVAILLIAFITIELPAAYQQLGSAFHAVHSELEEAEHGETAESRAAR